MTKKPALSKLRRAQEFKAVMSPRNRTTLGPITVWLDRHGEGRLGITVPKTVGPAAVRNRTKRRVREIYRNLGSETPYDVVIQVNRDMTFDALHESISQILEDIVRVGTTS